jgi:hypothetical protein
MIRIEVENPGPLLMWVTMEDALQGISKLRNRIIGRVEAGKRSKQMPCCYSHQVVQGDYCSATFSIRCAYETCR